MAEHVGTGERASDGAKAWVALRQCAGDRATELPDALGGRLLLDLGPVGRVVVVADPLADQLALGVDVATLSKGVADFTPVAAVPEGMDDQAPILGQQ